jgi:hypothetical protein
LKPERWGSALVQEHCKEETLCEKTQLYNDNDNNNNNNKHILKDPNTTNDTGRKCGEISETNIITGACRALSQGDYTHLTFK